MLILVPRSLLLVLLVLLPGAARSEQPHYRAHPEFAARMEPVKTIGLVRPAIRVFELTAGGGREFRADWSDRAAKAIGDAIADAMVERGREVVRLDPAPQSEEELRDVALLYEAVEGAILQATYFHEFPLKLARFDYSVGDLAPLLAPRAVDAVLFATGSANISSAGRSALQLLGALVGPGYSTGIDRIYLGLVDRTGAVLWFDTFASTGHDVRDPQSAAAFVRSVTAHLPDVTRSAESPGGKP